MTSSTKTVAGALVGLAGLVSLSACAGAAAETGSPKSVAIAGFSVLQTANQKVFTDFQHTRAGKGVTFTTSYGASGDESRSVASGLKVDEVHLSLEPDVASLVQAGIVPKTWDAGRNHGVLTQSVVVIAVRKGNPLHIRTWNDLLKPGVQIVTPDPGSSGSAKWNILAAYGHVLAQGGSQSQATAYLKKFVSHVVAWPGSGHDATTAFESGTGNVLISYEDEVIEARQAGAGLDYVVPPQTLLIQNTGALTKGANAASRAFLAFQLSKKGQTDYAEEGFRPLYPGVHVRVAGANDPANPYPRPQTLMTIDKTFGGWTRADTQFFDPQHGIVTRILAAAGKS